MCGRYVMHRSQELPARFNAELPKEKLPNYYNVSPGMVMPTITKNSPRKIELMRWGLIPHWAKDPKIGYHMINARDDSLTTKPSFKEPFINRRCLVPAQGFFEWQKLGNKKIPHYIKMKDDNIFSFAGLYDTWINKDREIKTFTIITTKPNKILESIHNRMPVILQAEDEDKWLSKNSPIADLVNLLKPVEERFIEEYIISEKVNSPKYQDEDVLKKL